MVEWGQPQNLVWFWLVPAAIAVFALSWWRRASQIRKFGETALVKRLTGSLDRRKRFAKRLFLAAALALIIVALAQPHFRKKETKVERMGIDILIAIDVSNSMLAKDVAPSRLEKAKLELSGLIDKLKGDRLGIVAFAGDAVIQCPLTTDKSAVKLFLSTAHPNLISYQGTSLSRAILVSTVAFGGEKEKGPKALILLTDGEGHDPEAEAAAARAKAENIKIFTIGIGTAEGSIVPGEAGGYKKDRQGQAVLSKLNEGMLKKIADVTGGSYHRATRGEGEVDRIVRDIRQISRKGMGSEISVEYEESYQLFLLIAFILLALEMALSEARRDEARP